MMEDLIIIGAGNPDIIKLLLDINDDKKKFNIIGILEKDTKLIGESLNGIPIIGDDSYLKKNNNLNVVFNILGNCQIRYSTLQSLISKYNISKFPNIIHPSVNMRFVNIGIGNIIYQNFTFGSNVYIKNFNILYYGSTIGHETKLGSFNLVAANSLIRARNIIHDRVFISNGVITNINLEITNDVFIGLGSVVVNSILKQKKMFGYPAKEMRF